MTSPDLQSDGLHTCRLKGLMKRTDFYISPCGWLSCILASLPLLAERQTPCSFSMLCAA